MGEEDEKKSIMVRFKDFIVRVFVKIGRIITCNKITIQSSCCEVKNVDNHTSVHNVTYNNTPESMLKNINKASVTQTKSLPVSPNRHDASQRYKN